MLLRYVSKKFDNFCNFVGTRHGVFLLVYKGSGFIYETLILGLINETPTKIKYFSFLKGGFGLV